MHFNVKGLRFLYFHLAEINDFVESGENIWVIEILVPGYRKHETHYEPGTAFSTCNFQSVHEVVLSGLQKLPYIIG